MLFRAEEAGSYRVHSEIDTSNGLFRVRLTTLHFLTNENNFTKCRMSQSSQSCLKGNLVRQWKEPQTGLLLPMKKMEKAI
jgi:hypothetical protein